MDVETRNRRRRTVAAAGAGALFCALALWSAPRAGAVPPPPGAIVVGVASPSCPAPAFATIQAAIDAATAGATVYICAGTYAGPLTVNKDLTLLGNQWGVDARTGRTDPAQETTLTGPGSTITVTLPAATVTLDGLTLSGGDTAVFAIAGSTNFVVENNIFTGNSVGINFNATGPAPTEISHNRFVTNNLPGPNSGSSIFVTSGIVTNLLIEENLFQGNVGDGVSNAADINTPGGATPSSGIVIQGNTSIDDATFLVANNTTGTQVTGNTITQTVPTTATGSAIVLFGTNTGMVVTSNTIDGGASTGVRAGGAFTVGGDITISGNQIANRTNGIRLGASGTFAATITGNTVSTSTTAGIWLEATMAGATVDANTISSTTGTDCQDDSTGSATAGTANTWTANVGVTSLPAGLCLPLPPTTTTTSPASTTTTSSPSTTTTDPGDVAGGDLARTGAGTVPLTLLGAALVAIGVLLLPRRSSGRHFERR